MRQAMGNFFSRWKADLFREPGRPSRHWFYVPRRWSFALQLLLAGFALGYGLFVAPPPPRPFVLALGSWGLLGALAELLPKEHTMLAGFLRLGSSASFVLVVVLTMGYLLSFLFTQ